MQRTFDTEHRWGVILAGGEGTRLRSLTRFLSCDDRPKQFCTLVAGRSLLGQTRRRIERSISPHRTLFVLLKSYEPFCSMVLKVLPLNQMLVQPRNRGTLPAVLYSLSRLTALDQDALVAFFPSD